MKYETKTADHKLMEISSPAFRNNDLIPEQYSCDGINISPPLRIGHIPEGTKSLAVIVEDPDAPSKTWIHWLMWNIPVREEIAEGEVPGVEGLNDFNLHQYGGPCPPSGTHRYYFKVFAIDTILELPAHTNVHELEKALQDHILSSGQLMGKYKRGSKK